MPFSSFSEIVAVSPLQLNMFWNEGRLKRIKLGWLEERKDIEPVMQFCSSGFTAPMQAALEKYIQGQPMTWPDMPLEADHLSEFSRKVLFTLRDEVPWGETISYGELAALCNKPGAARSIGRVMAFNPWPMVIPCHRVIGSKGALTGFSGAGLPMKEFLLKTEGTLPS